MKALSPARVKEVRIHEDTGTAEVIVPDYQLSLAIGKEGQNARLAARLTGWRVDIKSETQLAEEAAYQTDDWAQGEWIINRRDRRADVAAGRRQPGHDRRGVEPARRRAGRGRGRRRVTTPRRRLTTADADESTPRSRRTAPTRWPRLGGGRRGAATPTTPEDSRRGRRRGRRRSEDAAEEPAEARGRRRRGRRAGAEVDEEPPTRRAEDDDATRRRPPPAADLHRLPTGRRRRPSWCGSTRQGDGSLAVGPTLPGRGAWLCRSSAACFDAAQRRGAFARALRAPVAAADVEAVRDQVLDRANAHQKLRKG